MADDAKDEPETEEEVTRGRGHDPKGGVLVKYLGEERMAGRGLLSTGPTKPPLAYPPTYDLMSKKRLRIYKSLLLAAFVLMLFGGIAGFATDFGWLWLWLASALVGFLGIVFYGLPLAWKSITSLRRNSKTSSN